MMKNRNKTMKNDEAEKKKQSKRMQKRETTQ
jgi:hypothetical protein